MAGHLTFAMIKPTAVKNNHIGAILEMINGAGFTIKAMKFTQLSPAQAAAFYAVHKGKPFYEKLIGFMTSGPIVAILLDKENAVEDFRQLIGATNPEKAAEGTIRKRFAISTTENAVHGSDSDENATIEADFFFAKTERY